MSALLEERKARVRAEWEARFSALPGRPKKPWVGKTPKSTPPPDVRLRIVRTWDHICHITGLKITTETPHMDHVIPVEDGAAEDGLNAEWNLRPALPDAHLKIKTAAENKARDKADRAAKKKLGLKAKTKPIESQGFNEAPPQKKASGKINEGKVGAVRAVGMSNIARRFQNG